MNKAIALFLTLFCCGAVHSARILAIFPLPARSHYILGSSLARELAERGHDVTMISAFGEKNPPKNGSYRDIVLTEMVKALEGRKNDVDMYQMGDLNGFINIGFVSYLMSDISGFTLNETSVKNFLSSNKEKFDAVIVEQFYNDALKAFANHFKAHQIVFSTIGANFWVNPLVGNPSPLSYVPDIFLSYPPQMTFWQRLTNVAVYAFNILIHQLYLFPKQNAFVKMYFPEVGDVHDNVLYNASLVLLNSHPSFNQPIPHVPNMVEIGGYHVKPPKKLPEDLQKFLDDAKDEGVVYFSMGSNLRSADLPVDKRDDILRVFSQLKQKVIWKWEEDVLPNQPKNVKLGKWLPQQDILAHPSVKLFITHGGLLSTTEALYHGVPVLAIPIFGDQKINAQSAVNGGFGLSLPFRDLVEDKLRDKLQKLLGDPTYLRNAKQKSLIFHDRITNPMDTAVYWIEYVIRHKGAPHLRVAAVDLPWYQLYLVDVIAVVSFVALLSLVVGCFIIKKIWTNCILRKKTATKKVKTK